MRATRTANVLAAKIAIGIPEACPRVKSAITDAGKAYLACRKNRGTRRTPLPDFYSGAHAAVAGLTLVTRDPVRYRTYFLNSRSSHLPAKVIRCDASAVREKSTCWG